MKMSETSLYNNMSKLFGGFRDKFWKEFGENILSTTFYGIPIEYIHISVHLNCDLLTKMYASFGFSTIYQIIHSSN